MEVGDEVFGVAGAAPLTAGTALVTLDALALAPGDTVLVVGGTGGIAVRAWAVCATFVVPGLPEGEEYLRMPDASDALPRGGDLVPPYARDTPAGWARSSTA